MFHVKQHGLEGNLEHQIQILKKGVEILGLNLTSDQFRQFEIYLELLLFWNQRINLFSRRDVSRLAERHLLESLAWIPTYGRKLQAPVMDLGSGAGFPGVPIAIWNPGLEMTLVESKQKKARFLAEVIQRLGLNARVVPTRIEEITVNPTHLKKYRLIFARAVASLLVLAKWTQQLLAEGGRLVTFKGDTLQKELEELKSFDPNLGYSTEIWEYEVPENLQSEVIMKKRGLVSLEFNS